MSTTAQDAFTAGEEAYFKGLSETANPFDPSTDEHLSWNDGYHQAEEQDNPEPA